ncbi:Phosphatidylinositol 4-kinase pik1 [Schizosaccharomyces pombe]|uniref:Phosphatidylinositol 4-kinase pik1 n=2 Tax=Schizosaccharomyces pombe TaxID=4896 RepID=PIK1_SCHPO|nr:1-phosphatidylinositol 4-kinase Pik1 [Schizosaccharomyces pombe]Q10366.1 RecName: Full=Phosphatidylinositol 4-kinase pik1; Short=PI4-kinase; Short=PtdIns-4-kinase [Schizosaccharomyces pombe 972h-]ACR61542.1 Pik1 [Schizosaccharomyces pombe]CAA93903.1 1-phosphatidylinositol 4-kinase Pik1 [Schizosaccharomyces pombe]|eukprot:NP_594842.1 1-phosphatidylinositol 4-kinase Pik1 [Schizosaccharomyces pombe]
MPSSNSGNELLLRFFESAHFTSQLCVAYLSRYPNNIGIHHFLCEKLATFPYEEIEFFIPQLIHLVLNKDSESVALEEFIISQCEQNTQCALITFWYLQAHMVDLGLQPHSSCFKICKRLYNRIQILVFMSSSSLIQSQQKISENVTPALILSGIMLGGVCVPELLKKAGPIAIAQGRKAPRQDPDESDVDVLRRLSTEPRYSLDVLRSSLNNSIVEQHSEVSLRLKAPELTRTHSYQSSATLSIDEQRRVLRSNYFQQEIQFLFALQDISIRLIIVPRQARLSSLRAELALLNNNLPADVNIPLLRSYHKEVSHKIVRIDPKEATILNSAERVPYLIMVEVLSGELSFEPQSKKNKAKVQKIVSHKNQRKRWFDLTDVDPYTNLQDSTDNDISESESEGGDLSMSPLIKGLVPDTLSLSKSFSSFGNVSLQVPSSHRDTDVVLLSGRHSDSDGNGALKRSKIYASEITARMRAAATMLSQLDAEGSRRPKAETERIKNSIILDMQRLEEERLNEPSIYPVSVDISCAEDLRFGKETQKAERKGDRDDPSAATFQEDWYAKKERIRKSSPYGHYPNWDLVSVIVKTGADLRQETFACQLIYAFQRVWLECKEKVWVRRMKILVTGDNSGLIETITNAISVHSIKKNLTKQLREAELAQGKIAGKNVVTLKDYFIKQFGDPNSSRYRQAQTNFLQSLVAYSIISYLLQLKDRHNGNVLIDSEGHIIHIDFGFLLTNTPGNVGFESAPFKLTADYLEILDDRFDEYRSLMKAAFKSVRKNADQIILLVEVMQNNSTMPCFRAGENTSAQLLQRFQLQLGDKECDDFVDLLIQKANCSVWTRLYDLFQNITNGIY